MLGIKNFLKASENIATGGQPNAEQIEELQRHDFQVIVNLGLLGAPYALADEELLVRNLGMQYYHLPVQFDAPTIECLESFFIVMESHRSSKVFVHCAANYRVSSFISLYGQAKKGWTEEVATEFLSKVWMPNEIWRKFIEDSRQRMNFLG